MAFRRPRLKLQPNVVARPAARDAEPAAAVSTATEPAAKSRPQLPARFKRLAPRLNVGRAVDRSGGSTADPSGGTTVSPVIAPVTVLSTEAESALSPPTEALPPAKQPRLDSHRPHELEDPGGSVAVEPVNESEPSAPCQAALVPAAAPHQMALVPTSAPDQMALVPTSAPDQMALVPTSAPDQMALVPANSRCQMAPPSNPPHRLALPPPEPQEPPEPAGTELEPLSDSGDADDPAPTFSETDLYLRKRFKVPVRPKNNYREALEQITERVSDNMPIRTKMMMKDLILWNPSTEAMSNSSSRLAKVDRRRHRRDSTSSVLSTRSDAATVDDPETEAVDDPAAESGRDQRAEEPDDAMPVPQLKVGADGSIIVDEQSLVVKTSQQRQRDLEMSTTVMCDVNGSRISFNGYRQRRHINEWSIKETARFYKALSTVGTDFSIMQQLFPKRTRVDLKKKFKKEERKNSHLVERALRQDMQYDLTIFDDDEWETTVEKCKTVKQMQRESARALKKEERARDLNIWRKERAARGPHRKVKAEPQLQQEAAHMLQSLDAPTPTPTPATAPAPTPDRENVAPPTGVLQLPPGINPQNLLIIASPSPDRPDSQVLHVYMIHPPAAGSVDINATIRHQPAAIEPAPAQFDAEVELDVGDQHDPLEIKVVPHEMKDVPREVMVVPLPAAGGDWSGEAADDATGVSRCPAPVRLKASPSGREGDGHAVPLAGVVEAREAEEMRTFHESDVLDVEAVDSSAKRDSKGGDALPTETIDTSSEEKTGKQCLLVNAE